jgi:hypothetical protein
MAAFMAWKLIVHNANECRGQTGHDKYLPSDVDLVSKIFQPFVHTPPCNGKRSMLQLEPASENLFESIATIGANTGTQYFSNTYFSRSLLCCVSRQSNKPIQAIKMAREENMVKIFCVVCRHDIAGPGSGQEKSSEKAGFLQKFSRLFSCTNSALKISALMRMAITLDASPNFPE